MHMEIGIPYSFDSLNSLPKRYKFKREFIPNHEVSDGEISTRSYTDLLKLLNLWNSKSTLWKYWAEETE